MFERLFKSFSSLTNTQPLSEPDSGPLGSRSNSRPNNGDEPVIITRDEHCISRKNINRSALNVMYELNREGYEAYLVGGAVRDLLLGQQPKDFDVATNATPEQVKNLFKRSRIVGKRFKIVHVRAGREITEVTTFRASHDATANTPSQGTKQDAVTNQQGMLLRDNVYGSLREDALRRDFTVNALYYSVDGFTVLDYTSGMQDLELRQLKIIGDPEQRYAEDPVRLLRAVRLAAKLDFAIEPQTAAPIASSGKLLSQVAPARLFDEMSKLFLSGYGQKTLPLLRQYHLFELLFPAAFAAASHCQPDYFTLLDNALGNTDQRISEDKPVTPAFFYAVVLWPIVCERSKAYRRDGLPAITALQKAGYDAIESQIALMSIPKRFSIAARDIWILQQRLETINEKRTTSVLAHAKFRAAYDFLLLRNQSGEDLSARCDYWTEQQRLHPEIEREKDHRYRQRDNQKRNQNRYRNSNKHHRSDKPSSEDTN